MASVGPMLGQLWWFRRSAPGDLPLAVARYEAEAQRIFGVLDGRLADRSGIAGDYGIADIATWPWIESGRRLGLDVDPLPEPRPLVCGGRRAAGGEARHGRARRRCPAPFRGVGSIGPAFSIIRDARRHGENAILRASAPPPEGSVS